MKTSAIIAMLFLVPQLAAAVAMQAPRSAALFRIEADEFWLNLHHFLHALGRAEAKAPDATRAAVAGAPIEAERGLRPLTREEQQAWAAAVTAYSTGLSSRGLLDAPVAAITAALAGADEARTLAGVALDPMLAATLERAAPVYRKAWWPAHREGNRAWLSSMEALLDQHGATVHDFITHAYGQEWPTAGFAVHVSSYASSVGGYSSIPANLIVMSSLDRGTMGLHGLETIFHEGMHQWDNQIFTALGRHAGPLKTPVPRDLPHAMIFFTAGEAVRRVTPDHVPFADAFGVWQLRLSGATLPAVRFKPALQDVWKPYLEGRGTRDEALAALLASTAAERPQ